MSIEHTVAKILSFEVHTFIEQKFLDPGLNTPEVLYVSLQFDISYLEGLYM